MSYDVLEMYASANPVQLPDSADVRCGGVHMKKYTIPKGMTLVSHCHVYDHPSILASGKVELWTSADGLRVLEGPAEVTIAAGVKHALLALMDSVWYCVHADKGAEPEVMKEST